MIAPQLKMEEKEMKWIILEAAVIFALGVLVGCGGFFDKFETDKEYKIIDISFLGLSSGDYPPGVIVYKFNLQIIGPDGREEKITNFIPWKIEESGNSLYSFLKKVMVHGERHIIIKLSPQHLQKLSGEVKNWREAKAAPNHTILSQ